MQTFGGAFAAVWVGLLWYASPLLGGEDDAADRVRGVLVLGVLLPFGLGLAHALYAPALFAAAFALCALRYIRHRRRPATKRRAGAAKRFEHRGAATTRPERTGVATRHGERMGLATTWLDRVGSTLPVFVAAAAAWPALVRPLLEGDSLAYHLPNATAWVQSGSLWETGTRYWWYPGGSELFAAGLFAVSGPFSLGLAGTCALLLLGLRIYSWSRRLDAPPLLGGAVSAATLATLTIGLQAGNLLNDVWLGAFFLEVLYDARFARDKIGFDAAVCALTKPYGFAFAAYGLIAARCFDVQVLVPIAAFGAWLVRDAILWNVATIPPQTTVFPELLRTTIAANLPAAFGELARAFARDGTWTVVLAIAPLLGVFALKDRALCLAGIAALVAYTFMPFSYRNYVSQLAGGQSLRFAVPAFAVGAVVSLELLRRAWPLVVPLALVTVWFGLQRIAVIFWIDPHTHAALALAVTLALVLAMLRGGAQSLTAGALAAAAIVFANATAAGNATARYDEWLGPPRTRFFEWLGRTNPPRLVTSDVFGGAIVAISPATRMFDVLDLTPCDEARSLDALLLIRKTPPPTKTVIPAAVEAVQHCGEVVYDDAVVRVVRPTRAPTAPHR